jgi:ribulose 1,5-bisphosphate carboxylase large subunit-like protein
MFIYSPDLYLTNNFEQSVGLPVLVVPVITKIRLIEMHVSEDYTEKFDGSSEGPSSGI